jgi:hypothetical protein
MRRFAMSSVYEQEIEDGVFEDVQTPCVAVVPVTPTVYEAPKLAQTRPNANYVAQLIATAEQLPQTRNLRRAEPADALSAYSRKPGRENVAAKPAHLEKAA